MCLSVWVCTQVKEYYNNIIVSWVNCVFTLEKVFIKYTMRFKPVLQEGNYADLI